MYNSFEPRDGAAPLTQEELLLVDEYRRAGVRQKAASAFTGIPSVPTHNTRSSAAYIPNPETVTLNDPLLEQEANRKRLQWAVLGLNLLLLTALVHPGFNQGLENILGVSNTQAPSLPDAPGVAPSLPVLPSPESIAPVPQLPSPGGAPATPPPAPSLPTPSAPVLPAPPSNDPMPKEEPPAAPVKPTPLPDAPGRGQVTDAQLAHRVLAYFNKRGWKYRQGKGRYNIAYIQAMDLDNTLNQGRYNHFDDVRLIFEVINGAPRIVGKWQATTKPGDYYYRNPMNPKGTATLKTRVQFEAWIMGVHRRGDHPALVQHGGPVTVVRRSEAHPSGPAPAPGSEDTGMFGINQHGVVGANMPRDDIRRASAGCLVGQNWDEHRVFINHLRSDKDFRGNPGFVWTTGVIPGIDILVR